MKMANELVQIFLLIGIQMSQVSPSAISRLPATNSQVVRSANPRFIRSTLPARIPNKAVAIAGSELTMPSGSQVLVCA